MTDTPTDTAPEAITQADREAAADLLLTIDMVANSGADWIRAGHCDHGPTAQAFARHRCLNSHSAGAGLREALGEAVSILERLPYGDWPGGMYSGKTVAANAFIRRCRKLLTPPSDAGSTTRSGGEGVEALWKRACEGREGYCSSDLQDAARWAIGEAFRLAEHAARSAALPAGYQWSDGNREKFDFGRDTAADAIAALATTPSPDASPDSGEAEPVGWQYALDPCPLTGGKRWIFTLFPNEREARMYGQDARPVFARPSPSPAIVKEAGEA